jgi:phage FluMu protein Com
MTLVAVRGEDRTVIQGLDRQSSGEVVVFCPKCKALQTVQISSSQLMPTRKFFQRGAYIFHDCGSTQPCRLYTNV